MCIEHSGDHFHCNNTKTVNCFSHALVRVILNYEWYHIRHSRPLHAETWSAYPMTSRQHPSTLDSISCDSRLVFSVTQPDHYTKISLVAYLFIQIWLEVRGIANTVWYSGSNVLWLFHLYFFMNVFGNYQEILLTYRYKIKQTLKTLSTFNIFLMFLNVVFKLLF